MVVCALCVCLLRNRDCFDNLHSVLTEIIVYSIFAMDYDDDDDFDLDAIFIIMRDLEEDDSIPFFPTLTALSLY